MALITLAKEALSVALKAGEEILRVYEGGDLKTTCKEDSSPLTAADEAADRVIGEGLKKIAPGIPVLSEETKAEPYEVRKLWKRLWIVDPLDGTKEFIKRNGEFTVNIALVEDGRPIVGIVHAPALGVSYCGIVGEGAFRIDKDGETVIRVADYRGERLKAVGSRSHATHELGEFLKRIGEADFISMGSSLKFCLVAEGSAHLSRRFGPTMEWDPAAAHAVVKAAGGSVTDLEGRELGYNKEYLLNPFFMVTGAPPFPWQEYLEE
ncbi:MAG: 3'(2'),5'-bisphosphate nucleotidase CysQ [Deltaproteobacteria bacterium]|nr:3'(2'),5'-bisphosphate nucleotidase CysQ [Deltaproteobacteria bacterium]